MVILFSTLNGIENINTFLSINIFLGIHAVYILPAALCDFGENALVNVIQLLDIKTRLTSRVLAHFFKE